MSATLPLLGARDLDRPLAWQGGRPISAGTFIAEAQALAEQLPARGPAVNLCQDRYRFALGLAAALLRGHTSLMPPNALPDTLRRLAQDGPPPYALVDDDTLEVSGLQRVTVDPGGGHAPATGAGHPGCAGRGVPADLGLHRRAAAAPQAWLPLVPTSPPRPNAWPR
jgi:hypothetical protein